MKVESAPVPYGNQYGYKQRRDKLSVLLGKNYTDGNGNPSYIFTELSGSLSGATSRSATRLMADYSWRPDFLVRPTDPANVYTCPALHQFFVGGIGQGAPVHFHGANVLFKKIYKTK
jgi:hypothetical protein